MDALSRLNTASSAIVWPPVARPNGRLLYWAKLKAELRSTLLR